VSVAGNSTSPFQVNVATSDQSVTDPRSMIPGTHLVEHLWGRCSSTRLAFLMLCTTIFGMLGRQYFRVERFEDTRPGPRRIPGRVFALLGWILLSVALISCEGTRPSPPVNSESPAGTTTLTITATASGRKQSTPFALTVMPSTQ
jgi:hypothetical protein